VTKTNSKTKAFVLKTKENKKKRPGVHSKKTNGSHKHGNNYQKKYVGQGR
tara:strand:- start:373 stop:522 length:150 start_codon:yes stop_codon:yes gene_type:complete